MWAIVLGALLCAGRVLKTRLVFELHEFWKTEHRHCSQQFELQDIELPLTDICWELTNDFLLSEILHIKQLFVFFLENTFVMHQNHSFLYSILSWFRANLGENP